METPSIPPESPAPPKPRFRWHRWFLAGFFLAFMMGFFATTYFYTGQALVQLPVWRYYLLEMNRANLVMENLGPTSGRTGAAVALAFQHLALSALAGIVLVGIGAIVRRFKK